MQLIASSNEESQRHQHMLYSPLVFINNMIYKGDFSNEQNLYQTLCFAFQSFPPVCQKAKSFQASRTVKDRSIKNFFVKLSLFFVSLSVLAVFSLYLFIRRRQQADLKQNLQKKIDQALQEYYNTANQTYYRSR